MKADLIIKKAFIWDLDGTLLDSYKNIVACLESICTRYGKAETKEEILKFVIRYSVSDYLKKLAKECGKSFEEVKKDYARVTENCGIPITLIKGAKEILREVKERGYENLVYTHKGATTRAVLTELGIIDCFSDMVTSLEGFPRKPSPDGLEYLVAKWKLDKENTFYVGDRNLDMECARNAGVKGVFFLPADSVAESEGYEYTAIKELSELKRLF